MNKLLLILILPLLAFGTKYGQIKIWDGEDVVNVTPDGELRVSLDGHVDTLNSTSIPLDAGDTFIGGTVNIEATASVLISVYTDKQSATDGLCICFSTDSINFDNTDNFTIPENTGKTFSFQPAAKFYRIEYINGDSDQTVFRLQTLLKRTYVKPSSHRIEENISGQDDAELVKSVITGKDEDGIYRNQLVNSAGVSLTSNFLLEVTKGNIAGHTHVNKFGHNTATVSGDDVWGGGGVYAFYPDTAQSMDIQSTSALDDSGNVGAWQVVVLGLDSNWLEITELVTLNGTTPVNLSNKFIRMYRAFVYSVGSSDTNVGTITIEIQGTSTVGAHISSGEGQTQQTIYTIPANKTGYFLGGYAVLANADKNGQDGVFQVLSRTNSPVKGSWQVKYEVPLVNIGTSGWTQNYLVPAGPIPGKTDIRFRLSSATATMHTVAGYDILLEE